jgi:nucleoside-diphosphate kinase
MHTTQGFKLVALRLVNVDRGLAEKHYADLSSKPFFGALVGAEWVHG